MNVGNSHVVLFFVLLALLFADCERDATTRSDDAFEVALDWNEFLLELDRFSEGYRPPVSARMFAYCGIAAWESILPAYPEAISCSTSWKNLQLPVWKGTQDFVPAAALNAAYAGIARLYYPHAPIWLKNRREQLAASAHNALLAQYPAEAVLASQSYGRAVAEAVFQWSATDAVGHQAFLYNYDRNFQLPQIKGQWYVSEQDVMPPLLPYWGRARTFLSAVSDTEFRSPIEFSEAPNAPFFAQAMEVYVLSNPIKEENRWIAEFWSDDFPGVTFSAASRWISITNQALDKARPDLLHALETWLRVGWALNDVIVNVWHAKYTFRLERPYTYIQRNINSKWEPLHHTPPFPAYPSGHAGLAAAATSVLTSMLGENFVLTDRSHQGRKEFLGKPRSYQSFEEMAAENAFSRILMGVHFRMDCEEGLRIGGLVGKKTSSHQLYVESKYAGRH
ncbi:MAG: vanadium-dependent haloperoxidase [Saprospiraceae bacterium]|nr:vanadium-dependent haloperoxidase [Saprospiraceae bacterium]